MQVKEHYDKHLGNFYSWMVGDLAPKTQEFEDFLVRSGVSPGKSKVAIDLGAGNGLQSIALKNLGFQVTAIDFNKKLLDELRANPKAAGITTKQVDISTIGEYEDLQPELIICCGDTITHLENKNEIKKLITASQRVLTEGGKLILTYRDYATELTDQQRFIPVKSSPERILTCILEYHAEKVKVTDLLYEIDNGDWKQLVSSYEKVRVSADEISAFVQAAGMKIEFHQPVNRMQTLIAQK